MSDARQGESKGDEQPDIAIEESDSVAEAEVPAGQPPAAVVTPPSGTPLSKFAAPPPAAGVAPPNGVPTPKPGSLASAAKMPVAVTEPAPPDVVLEPPVARLPVSAGLGSDGIHVVFAGMTSVGLVREHNEDNLVIADLATKGRQELGQTIANTVTASGAMFAVCDGMGGAAAGEVASQMAVDFLFENLTAANFGGDRDTLARQLVSVVERAGKQIFDTAQADRSRRGMGTTSTVAVLLDKVLFVAQVGDSRAYILRNGVLKQVTKDQSLVNQLIEAGHLTEEEAEAFEHSNIILQALGTSEKVQVDLTFVELRQSDRLMMCSDGLSGLVHAETIAETLRSVGEPSACCARLTELANEGGGHDNITVIVADFTGNALPPPQSGETAGYNQYPLLPEGSEAATSSPASGDLSRSITSASGESPRNGAWQWWVMGLVAILVGVAISWWWENKQSSSLPPPAEPPAIVLPEAKKPPAPVAEPPEPELVPVRVSTDAEAGQLLIDGEPRGALSVGAPRDLDLAPGSYRAELQIEGSVAVGQLVTVESGKPLELVLGLPSGANDAPEPQVEAEPSEPSVRRARPPAVAAPVLTPQPDKRAETPHTPSRPAAELPAKAPAATKSPAVPSNPF